MNKFNPVTEPQFKKTGDVFIDSIIKYCIFNPITVTTLFIFSVEIYLIISMFVYDNLWLFLLMIIFAILCIIVFVGTKFSDKFFDVNLDNKTHFMREYEYMEKKEEIKK